MVTATITSADTTDHKVKPRPLCTSSTNKQILLRTLFLNYEIDVAIAGVACANGIHHPIKFISILTYSPTHLYSPSTSPLPPPMPSQYSAGCQGCGAKDITRISFLHYPNRAATVQGRGVATIAPCYQGVYQRAHFTMGPIFGKHHGCSDTAR